MTRENPILITEEYDDQAAVSTTILPCSVSLMVIVGHVANDVSFFALLVRSAFVVSYPLMVLDRFLLSLLPIGINGGFVDGTEITFTLQQSTFEQGSDITIHFE